MFPWSLSPGLPVQVFPVLDACSLVLQDCLKDVPHPYWMQIEFLPLWCLGPNVIWADMAGWFCPCIPASPSLAVGDPHQNSLKNWILHEIHYFLKELVQILLEVSEVLEVWFEINEGGYFICRPTHLYIL